MNIPECYCTDVTGNENAIALTIYKTKMMRNLNITDHFPFCPNCQKLLEKV